MEVYKTQSKRTIFSQCFAHHLTFKTGTGSRFDGPSYFDIRLWVVFDRTIFEDLIIYA